MARPCCWWNKMSSSRSTSPTAATCSKMAASLCMVVPLTCAGIRPSARLTLASKVPEHPPVALMAPPYRLERLGIVMEPLPGDPQEVEGVLDPATAGGRDGELYLFPRLVARGNFSRIGRACVRSVEGGRPTGAERPGLVAVSV